MTKRDVILLALLCILAMVVPAAPVSAGLMVTDGEKIISPYGNTSPILTVTDSDIPSGGTITIDVMNTYYLIYSGKFTDANLVITSDAANATWTGTVSSFGDLVTLSSSGGNTTVGENITVTFTGAGGNPWMPGTADIYGDMYLPLTVTRTDTSETASISFWIETASIPPGGLTVEDGAKITSPYGAASPVITIADSDIPAGGTISIQVQDLYLFIQSGTFTDANVLVNDTAAGATWTGAVSGLEGLDQIITLTSAGGPTAVGETITVTFTGSGGNPWSSDTSFRFGDMILPLTVTRLDTFQTAFINFMIETTPPPGGLAVSDGAKITSPDGATSAVITIMDADVASDGTLTIDMSGLIWYVASGTLTDANIEISDTAAGATWTGSVAGDTLTLTSTSNSTLVGETVNVTFTGAGGNPWIPDTFGEQTIPLRVTRTDTLQTATITFVIETTPPPGGLTITGGAKITSPDGATSAVITITDTDIAQDGTLTIDVTGLQAYVAGGALTDANVMINDTAVNALWTGIVSGNILTLTSTNDATIVGETVNVTFTGAGGNPWISNTHGEQNVSLIAMRTDGLGWNTLNFLIETAPPPGFGVVANFTASPTSDLAPLTVTFNDTSLGSPASWSWDFGDGNTSTDHNPVHTYYGIGSYTVTLTATNAYGSDTKILWDYIKVLHGGVWEANTSIPGLYNGGGPQAVMVDTSVLPATLIPINAGSSVFPDSALEIQPPANSGFKNITIYALDGIGFSRNGNLIYGNTTGVHLVTEEITPLSGFTSNIGTKASFNYRFDLPSYPFNAILSTKIWEGVIPEYDIKLRQILEKNNAGVVGTAYTAKVTKINFTRNVPVNLHMSIDSNWNSYPNLPGGPGMMFIWQIAEDGNSGQVLPTNYLYNNTIDNLDYYEAVSPSGVSTFGLSSLTGNNNPFQVIAFVAITIINPPDNPDPYSPGGGGEGSGAAQTPVVSGTPSPNQTKAVKIYSNDHGTVTQITTLRSHDGLAKISLDPGVVALNSSGMPLESISIRNTELPAVPPDATLSFAGMAYEIEPDGATFTPAVPLSFTIPPEMGGQDYVIQEYDHATGTWLDLPTDYDPQTRTITVQVSHLCCFALFEVSMQPAPTPEPTILISSKSSVQTNVEMYGWVFAMVTKNPVIIVIILAALAAVAYFGWWKRRL